MEFDLQNILVLLFILFPLIQRIFGKKAPPAEMPEEIAEKPVQNTSEDTMSEEAWKKELERLFGVPVEAQEPVADFPKKQEPVIERAPVSVQIPAPRRFDQEFSQPVTKSAKEKPAKISAAEAYTFHSATTMQYAPKSAVEKPKETRFAINKLLHNRKELQKAIILSEILNRPGHKRRWI
jgi:hypothetical protein